MADLDRRGFLAGTGLAAGLLAGCRPRKDPYTPDKPPVPLAPGVRMGAQTQVLSTCGMCDVGCGIRVRVVDGRAVRVEGNADSPVNRGGLCARGLAGLDVLYHPDRVRGPMRRRGGRGENRWEVMSWDDAVGELAARLGRLRAAEQAGRLVLLDGQWRGNTHALLGRFMAAFGSPNHIGHGATGRSAILETVRTMTGRPGLPRYDFQHAGCVLLLGTGALESSSQAMPLGVALAAAARPRLYCASLRLPRTAALVDEWFRVLPGRASFFLLGLLHVLLREQLADESAMEKADGFEALRAVVLAELSPKQVEARAGIDADRIESLARELVAIHPSVVVVDEETKDRSAVAAALVLNAALASIDARGGMRLGADETAAWPAPTLDGVAEAAAKSPAIDGREIGRRDAGASRILAVPGAILSGKPYPVEVVLLHYSNPMFSKPGGARFEAALAKVPFVVSFSPIVDESVRFADLVLPDPTYLERWDVLAAGQGTLSVAQPVVAPLENRMQTGEVLLRLARALGGTVARSFPWKTYREAVLARLDVGGRGDDLLDELGSKGTCMAPGKSDEADEGKSFAGFISVATATQTLPLLEESREFPFLLCPFRDHSYAEGGFRHVSRLAELPNGPGWSGYVEIAPEDADRLGIEDGDWVAVTSKVARVELRARVHEQIRPGVLGLPLGGWGRVVGDLAGAPSRLLEARVDPATGQWLAWETRAKVERVG